MLCPSCKNELIVTGQARLETLDEHVSCSRFLLKISMSVLIFNDLLIM